MVMERVRGLGRLRLDVVCCKVGERLARAVRGVGGRPVRCRGERQTRWRFRVARQQLDEMSATQQECGWRQEVRESGSKGGFSQRNQRKETLDLPWMLAN